MRTFTKIILIIFVFSSFIAAQSENNFNLYFNGGIGLPTGPKEFSDNWKLGYNFGGGIGIPVTPSLSLILNANYNYFPADVDKLFPKDQLRREVEREMGGSLPSGVDFKVEGLAIKILTISGDAKYMLVPESNSVIPFIIARVGYLSMSTSDITVTVSYQGQSQSVSTPSGVNTENAIFVGGGAGIEIMVSSNINCFLEADYNIGFTKGNSTSFVPVKAGVKLSL